MLTNFRVTKKSSDFAKEEHSLRRQPLPYHILKTRFLDLMPPNAKMFRDELCRLLQEAELKGASFLDVRAGDLHQAVGGYPGPDARMPICCSVMRSVLREKGGSILQAPPKGNGASLIVRYQLASKTIHSVSSDPLSFPTRDRETAESTIDQEIYEKLIVTAQSKETTTYQAVASLKGMNMEDPANRARLALILGEISKFEHNNHRPLLSTVVVSKTTGIPGQGFFQLAKRLGVYDGKDHLAFFVSELRKVHEYRGSSLDEIVDEDEEEVLDDSGESDLEVPRIVKPVGPKTQSQDTKSVPEAESHGGKSSTENPEESDQSESAPGFFRRVW